MKELEPEDKDPKDRELERIWDEISAGTIEDVDELDPGDLQLLLRHHGSQEEVDKLFDRLKGPSES